jgi:hypothetical protein
MKSDDDEVNKCNESIERFRVTALNQEGMSFLNTFL